LLYQGKFIKLLKNKNFINLIKIKNIYVLSQETIFDYPKKKKKINLLKDSYAIILIEKI
jgi:hypothetical protein